MKKVLSIALAVVMMLAVCVPAFAADISTDGGTGTTLFFPVSKLYPNTRTRVGFVLPSDVETGSTWQVTLCTQLGNNGSKLLKSPRTVTMENTFTVGEASYTPAVPDDGEDDTPGGNDGEEDSNNPLA